MPPPAARPATRRPRARPWPGPEGAHLRAATTIAQPVETVYAFWRNLDHLSMALPSTITIERLDDRRSRWSLAPATGSAPTLATWTAEIINDEPERVIGWRTVDESDIVSAGSVQFKEAPARPGHRGGRSTCSTPRPSVASAPVSPACSAAAPIQVVDQCLRDIKRYLELGRQVTLRANATSR